MKIDPVTKRWIRNAADERAARNGCWFDEDAGQFVADWMEQYLILYEGERAGEFMQLMDWQRECTMQMFGWMRNSERWGRAVRRFTQATILIPKKNAKTPTLAAWGLYLFMADGEQGQKVFSCAKDGQQAKLSHRHAVEMVNASDALRAECIVNKSTMTISHQETRSTYQILSSDNAATQKAKEGINGSILIDEIHVVDRAFVNRISRAGISRSEPFMIEVSTAGNDPMSYGRERYDYGKSVESGKFHDERLFFKSWEAPQDLGDDALDEDPISFGKLANPAWGNTVGEEEYLDDYRRSKKSINDLAEFKMYRLNIWQRSASPWLKAGDWDACRRADLSVEQFVGEPCWMSLDKSKTRDMTAVVMVFSLGDGEYFQHPIFWLPERTAEENNHVVPFLQWAHDGYLELIPGAVVQDRYIEEKVAELADTYNIQGIWYDKTYAEDITQRFEEELGIIRAEFPQTTMMFAGPVDDYERLVIDHKLHHDGHPILSWQAGHVTVHQDTKGRKTLVKPQQGDLKKIDGMVAGVMALFGAIHCGMSELNFYETHDLEFG